VLRETLRQLRYEKGWSVLQFSKWSGVPKHLIKGIESGCRPYVPSEANTVLLGEALRVSVGLLLADRDRLIDRYC
jgi:transcriptional regulator with XRE-family HTH domain